MLGDGVSPDHEIRAARGTDDPLIGRVIATRYKVLRKVGEGGMGAVYLARHAAVEMPIALKVLFPDLARPEVVARFIEEARTAARIVDENVIDIFYSGQSDGLVFLAMEYLDGVDLGQVMKRSGPLPWKRAQPILLQIAKALGAAHAQGIVHRDIKPQNVFLVTRDGNPDFVKVLDFGIAKVNRESVFGAPRMLGTPEYMAPEPTLGQKLDGRADVYSFGCLMYHLLTGELPFQAPKLRTLLAKHAFESPVPPRQRSPHLDIPPEVDAIVMRALEKKRENRWQTMEELRQAMAAVPARPSIRSRVLSPVEPVPAERPRRITFEQPTTGRARPRVPWRSLGLALVSVGLLAYAGFLVLTKSSGRIQVTTVPEDAAVFLDGRQVGTRSPLMLEGPPGRYVLEVVRPGYQAGTETVEVRSWQTREARVVLAPEGPTGIEIASEPAGLLVWLDGQPVPAAGGQARTPLRIAASPGRHVLELGARHGARSWRQELVVEPGALVNVSAKLPR